MNNTTLIIIGSIILVTFIIIIWKMFYFNRLFDFIINDIEELKEGTGIGDQEVYKNGNNNMFNLVLVSLFKLREKGELFGYEDIINSLNRTLQDFSGNEKDFEMWKQKYMEYMSKEQIKGD
jgi:hypothetical protein